MENSFWLTTHLSFDTQTLFAFWSGMNFVFMCVFYFITIGCDFLFFHIPSQSIANYCFGYLLKLCAFSLRTKDNTKNPVQLFEFSTFYSLLLFRASQRSTQMMNCEHETLNKIMNSNYIGHKYIVNIFKLFGLCFGVRIWWNFSPYQNVHIWLLFGECECVYVLRFACLCFVISIINNMWKQNR